MKKLLQKLKRTLIIVACILGVAILLFAYGVYIVAIKKSLAADSLSMLNALSEQGVGLVKERILSDIDNIEVRADAIGSMGNFDLAMVHNYVEATSKSDSKSSRVILSKPDGSSFASDGAGGNLAKNANFKRAMNGESALMRVESASLDPKENVVMISVPVKANDQSIIGVLSCVYMAQAYGEIMNINDLGTTGRYCVVDSNGRFVMQYADMTGAEITAENMQLNEATITKIKADMKANKGGNIGRSSDEKIKDDISYLPIGINDWYLISFIPHSQVDGKTVGTYNLIVLVTAIVFLLIIGLFVVLAIIQKRMREQLAHKAYYDSLTDIPNQAKLNEFFGNLHNKGNGYVYIHLNVDNFWQAISVFGYETGNHMLKAIAKVLDSNVKHNEIAARLRDDAFALLLKFDDDAHFAIRLKNIMEKLETVEATDGTTVFAYSCKYSCGTYSITGEETAFDDIINMARFTSTLVRDDGTGVAIYASDQMQESLKLRNKLLPEAASALQEKQIVAYMQPKYDIKTKKINAAETFARWVHPTLGIIQPKEFLSVIELSGNILELDLYMFEEACKLMKKWIDEEQMPVPLSVNISAFNFYEVNFVDKIMDIVRQYGVPACLMNLEIDQKALISHPAKSAEIMNLFHEKAFILSVDNFGDEAVPMDIFYSFPIDVLNLSANFIQRARDDESVKRVFKMVTKLAKDMKIIIAAQGVELQEQEDFLATMSCEMVQGYLYSVPQPREEFEKLIF